jgi:acyl-homoserine lactone acylase PvdQ
VADLYRETIEKRDNYSTYLYDGKYYPVKTKKLTVNYKQDNGLKKETFTTYATAHGPVVGIRNGQWLSLRENNRSLNALMQSWLRTKAKGLKEFKQVMELRSNTSDNTVFADSKGNIAYWHGNFVPRRNPKLDYSLAMDGSISLTDWKGIHALDEIVHIINPKTGWIQNCNSTPFTVSGISSPKKEAYPLYMAPDGQNGRAINAIRLLTASNDVTLDKMIAIGYNTYLTAFDILLPSLFSSFDKLKETDPLKQALEEPVHLLKTWDRSSSTASVATTLAIEWASKLAAKMPQARSQEQASNVIGNYNAMATNTSANDKLNMLQDVLKELEKNFSTWRVPWGDINRYQRTTTGKFDDNKQSWPVGLAPGAWGALPSYASRRFDTKKRYGTSGNSFVAAVELGKRLKAKTILVSGESFDPASKHFNDQAAGYIEGKFKDIYFYKEDVLKHAERTYKPGE